VDGRKLNRFENKKSIHISDYKKIIHISITGYSIEPSIDGESIQKFFVGFFSYPEKWYCDHNDEMIEDKNEILGYLQGGPERNLMPFTDKSIIHKGNFGKLLEEPYTFCNENNFCTHALAIFENGYVTFNAIERKKYVPIFINIFTNKDMDSDLILDHLRAPAIKFDGLGLFNLSIVKSEKNVLDDNYFILQTIDDEFVNRLHYNNGVEESDPIKLESIRQNDEENKIFCCNCDSLAEHWNIISDKTFPVCKKHNSNMETPYKPINYYGR
jgi:hypothetical protein